jgi:alanyl-tRNA synthetase
VEDLINKAISDKLPVRYSEMESKKALQSGALGFFENRYDEKVKVYAIGSDNNPFSKEICGGPHVENTGELGHFKIIKEEAVSAGVRRIKAILE